MFGARNEGERGLGTEEDLGVVEGGLLLNELCSPFTGSLSRG
jgi:hypothetical protein